MDSQSTIVGVGGALLGVIVTKLITRTATSIENLPELEWRVKALEKKLEEAKTAADAQDRELQAVWRELAKAKSWINVAAELARGKGMELTTPQWGKEP